MYDYMIEYYDDKAAKERDKAMFYGTLIFDLLDYFSIKKFDGFIRAKIRHMIDSYAGNTDKDVGKITSYLLDLREKGILSIQLTGYTEFELEERMKDLCKMFKVKPDDSCFEMASSFIYEPLDLLETLIVKYGKAKKSVVECEENKKDYIKLQKKSEEEENKREDSELESEKEKKKNPFLGGIHKREDSELESEKDEKKESIISREDEAIEEHNEKADKTELIRIEKVKKILEKRKSINDEDLKSEILDLFGDISYFKRNYLNSRLTIFLQDKSLTDFMRYIDDIDEIIDFLSQFANLVIQDAIIYLEACIEDPKSDEVDNLLANIESSNGLEIYKKQYDKFMKKFGNHLSAEQAEKLISFDRLKELLNNELRKKILSKHYSSNEINRAISVLTSYMTPEEIASLYDEYQKINYLPNLDQDKSVIGNLQKAFALAIMSRMKKIDDIDPEEFTKRLSAVCHDYFSESPYKTIDPTGKYSTMEQGYAKERVESATLVREAMDRYYNQPLLIRTLKRMDFSKLKALSKKEVLSEKEQEEVKRMI